MIKPTNIGERIAHFLRVKGISQKDFIQSLEEVSGMKVTQPTVSHWTKGRTSPPIEIAPALCEVFDITLQELFDVYDEGHPKDHSQLMADFRNDPESAYLNMVEKFERTNEELKATKKENEKLERKLKEATQKIKKWFDE